MYVRRHNTVAFELLAQVNMCHVTVAASTSTAHRQFAAIRRNEMPYFTSLAPASAVPPQTKHWVLANVKFSVNTEATSEFN